MMLIPCLGGVDLRIDWADPYRYVGFLPDGERFPDWGIIIIETKN